MTESIFDPKSGETEHSGNQNLGPQADDISHLPSHFRKPPTTEDDTVVDLGLPADPNPDVKSDAKPEEDAEKI